MPIDAIQKIVVIGAGTMGRQLAILAANSGFQTVCCDSFAPQVASATDYAAKYFEGRIAKGRMTQQEADESSARLSFVTDIACVRDADFVLEAIIENLKAKRELFAQLDALCKPECILATNSSMFVASMIASATKRPDKVVNMHFFNPALVMKAVEICRNEQMSDDTFDTTAELARKFGKTPTLLQKEVYGFIGNRILNKVFEEAFYLLDTGVATIEDIDNACTGGLNFPMGPFRLIDLVGVDIEYAIKNELYKRTGAPNDMPWISMVSKYAKGELGEKTGKGFYEYPDKVKK